MPGRRGMSYKLLVALLLIGSLNLFLQTRGKEVDVTDEWVKLGENDTIPAGVHVRMDMTTGDKWVKTISDADTPGGSSQSKQQSGSSALSQLAVVGSDGEVDASLLDEPGYDFAMMHRTLSHLPEEEKERFGGLPELPEGYLSGSKRKVSHEQFEQRMAEIWEQRQEELKEMEENIANLPEVLKDRIRRIQEYLHDPRKHLQDMDLEGMPEEEDVVTHIVSVLIDLEYQLTDIDMTRDFHTLGGWQTLVSLLSDHVHVSPNVTSASDTNDIDIKIRTIQRHAAWVVGTAVKNTGEFFPYAVEPVLIKGYATTALDLLVDLLVRDFVHSDEGTIRKLKEKAIYGVGSLLRGNRMAQAHICTSRDVERLGHTFQSLVKDLSTGSSSKNKLVEKFLSLAHDMIAGVEAYDGEASEQWRDLVIANFASDVWCESTAELVTAGDEKTQRLKETTIQTISLMAPHCQWDKARVEQILSALERRIYHLNQVKGAIDSDHRDELLRVAERAQSIISNRYV